jgi:hypothetical protein
MSLGVVFAACAVRWGRGCGCQFRWCQGLISVTPVRARCLVLRLAWVQPLARVVAAIRASGGSMLCPVALSVLWRAR